MMLRLDVIDERRPPEAVLKELTRLVHGCFNHRRKTMLWNLRELLGPQLLQGVEADGRWDLAQRPERITPSQWVQLATFVAESHAPPPT